MDRIIVTLEIQMDSDEWDPASMGLPFLESDSGYEEPSNWNRAVTAMVKRSVVESSYGWPLSFVRAYYSDESSENLNFQARWPLVESDWNDLEFEADMASR